MRDISISKATIPQATGWPHGRILAAPPHRLGRPAAPGGVTLVGAGPGDPDLLTVRALRALRAAEVVIHDRLIGPGILDLAHPKAHRIDVGKAKGRHTLPQAGINALLAEHARAGQRVVRLKGGDPFVFGRGGEELEYLRARGIPVDIVPGVTAAAGCAAAAGLPLTHRDLSSAVTFVSGQAKDGTPDLDWPVLARNRQTLVVYMGLSTAGAIARELTAHGMDPATPAAVIENGTCPDQRVVTGTVATLERLIETNAIASPALIVIGAVAGLADAKAHALAALAPEQIPSKPASVCDDAFAENQKDRPFPPIQAEQGMI
jgi:uroporphyrin-III C-methyltransferase/precorrin-2 dehydrogenase/sirohydrochlorin ferrochelatase